MSRKALLSLVLVAFVASLTAVSVMAKEHGEGSKGGWIGIYLQDITADIKEDMDLKSREGVLVVDVVKDSPAEQAGIESKDAIIGFAKKGEPGSFEKVEDTSQLRRMVNQASPGQEVKLKILRGDQEKIVTVTVGQAPEDVPSYENMPELPGPKTQRGGLESYFFSFSSGSRIGVKVQDLTTQLGEHFGVENGEGALVTEVEKDMPAEKAGLKAGDVIVEVDSKKIEDTEDLMNAISRKEGGDKVTVKAMRDRQPRSFTVEVEKEKGWSSSDLGGLDRIKIFKERLPKSEQFWSKESRSDLEDQLQDLKDQLQDLKDQIEELRDKIR
ncbi:MAG: PDZ domain-containing protein [Candidatus Zixiibacteriota bacterium]